MSLTETCVLHSEPLSSRHELQARTLCRSAAGGPLPGCAKPRRRNLLRQPLHPLHSSYRDRSYCDLLRGSEPPICIYFIAFLQNVMDVVGLFPPWEMRPELGQISDPPDMISGSIFIGVSPNQWGRSNSLAYIDCLHHGTIAESSATDVINLPYPGSLEECVKRLDKVITVDIVSNLFAFVAKYLIWRTRNAAFHQISKKTM